MKVFFATYPDFIKYNTKPNEDYFLVSKKYPIVAVADGVTEGRFADGRYAYPAGARAAAEIFCFAVVEYLENTWSSRSHIGGKPNLPPNLHGRVNLGEGSEELKKAITQAFDEANKRIWELNVNEGIVEKYDAYANDYFDCVGVMGLLYGDTLYYGYVGDCGLAIFDAHDTMKFQTEDQVKNGLRYFRETYPEKNFSSKEQITIMHKEFRNREDGRGYGSFSGEPGVAAYYTIGSYTLVSGDLAIFYSDGFAEYLGDQEFLRIVRQGDKEALDDFTTRKAVSNIRKFGADRTLVSFALPSGNR